MPKLKTKSGAKKRFFVTKNRKFKYQKAGRRHRLISETPKTNRQLRKHAYVHDSDWKKVAQMMPYA